MTTDEDYKRGVRDAFTCVADALRQEAENFLELALRHERAGDEAPVLFNARFVGQYMQRLATDIEERMP